MVGIDRLGEGDGKMLMGFAYTKCALDLTNAHFINDGLFAMEDVMSGYCLLLLIIENENFTKLATL